MRPPVVLCYGMGNNSKAMMARLVKEKQPIDLILSADTGGELPHTYEDAQQTSRWLQNQGYPAITFVKYVTKRWTTCNEPGEILTLEEDCLRRKQLPSVAYGFKTCSDRWKIRPQDEYIKKWQPAIDAWAAGLKVVKLIGYHAGETRRVKDFDDNYERRYPLIEWDMDNWACLQYLREAYLTIPGKSSCFFCPNRKSKEVLEMRSKYPDHYKRAIALEDNAKENHTKVMGLGRRFSWREVKGDEDVYEDQPCGCADG